jgi:hypothetical protein
VLRLIAYSAALAIIGSGVVAHAKFKIGVAAEECARGKPVEKTTLQLAKDFAACVYTGSGMVGRILLNRPKSRIDALPSVPCRYVGTWASNRGEMIYKITLKQTGEFLAVPLKAPADAEPLSGIWGVHRGVMVWLYDSGLTWPPDVNDIEAETPNGFRLRERNGERTDFSLMEGNPPGCR